MKKKLLTLALALAFLLCAAMPAFAADLPRLVDEAGLLTAGEAATVEATLNQLSEQLRFDFVVVTLDGLNGMTPEDAACYIYDEYHYGVGAAHDGAILLISMEDRDWCVTSTGFGQEALNEDARDYLADCFLSDLSSGYYADAFLTFAQTGAALVQQAQNGSSYRKPFPVGVALGISLGVSLLAALITLLVLKGQLKSVRMKGSAADYVVPGTLRVTVERDRFLYNTVHRTRRSDESGGSRSSSGGHSSTSGKF